MKKNSEDWGDSLKVILREYAESLVIAIVLALLVRAYVVSAYQVPTSSMNPTLIEGDFIFGYKLPFGVKLPFSANKIGASLPGRGEVVIFRCPENKKLRCIKRVVGLPGDRVEIVGKRLLLNGKPALYEKAGGLSESGYLPLREAIGDESRLIYITEDKEFENFGPIIVPPGHFFALSDNRDLSSDSRIWGAIPFDLLESRALFVWLSFDWGQPGAESTFPQVRWSRLFHSVD